MELIKFFADIQKVDEDQRMVFGYASTTALDSQGEIITKEALSKALVPYMKFANIREMHQPSAVGVAKSAEVNETGMYIAAKVVDADAWNKVKEGVYKGFSIGGRSLIKNDNVIEELQISEISLVDRPANPECVIEVYKCADINRGKSNGIEKSESSEDSQSGERQSERECGDIKETVIEETSGENSQSGESGADEGSESGNTSQSQNGDHSESQEVASQNTGEQSTQKSESQKEIKKGLYDVAMLSSLVESLNSLRLSSEGEAQFEGDNSPLPEKLKDAVKNLSEILREMVAEETQELVAEIEYAEKSTDIHKAGARNSKGDGERIQKMHDIAMELGAGCSGADSTKSAVTGDIQKMQDDIAKLKEAKTELEKQNKEMEEKIKKFEAMPMPAKGAVRAVTKGAEIISGAEEEEIDTKDPMALVKMIHKRPQRVDQFFLAK